MTEKKKRGLLSWLGFGEEEQNSQTTHEQKSQDIAEVVEQVEVIEQPVQESQQVLQDVEPQQEDRAVEQQKPPESFFVRV